MLSNCLRLDMALKGCAPKLRAIVKRSSARSGSRSIDALFGLSSMQSPLRCLASAEQLRKKAQMKFRIGGECIAVTPDVQQLMQDWQIAGRYERKEVMLGVKPGVPENGPNNGT